MAMVVSHPVDDEHAEIINGRPDLEWPRFDGSTLAKKFPPFVFGIRGCSCVVHKIARVELHWWRVAKHGHALAKLKKPVMVAHTNCQQFFRLDPDVARTCKLPEPNAMLCGRCHGEPATFGKHGKGTKAGIKRQEAHVKLGCVVNGY